MLDAVDEVGIPEALPQHWAKRLRTRGEGHTHETHAVSAGPKESLSGLLLVPAGHGSCRGAVERTDHGFVPHHGVILVALALESSSNWVEPDPWVDHSSDRLQAFVWLQTFHGRIPLEPQQGLIKDSPRLGVNVRLD